MSEKGAKYEVVLIEEGLGNLNDVFFYSKEALKYAEDNKVFEGAQAYANHPSKMEEAILPERSVKDIIGYYENVKTKISEDGTMMLVGDLCTLPGENYDWSRSLIETALDVSGKFDNELVGFSINAGGMSDKKDIDDLIADETLSLKVKPKLLKARDQGKTEIEYCTQLAEAVSCDLVTKAGARGRALKKLVESERDLMAKKIKENEKHEKKEEMEKHEKHESHEDPKEKKEDGGEEDHADADQDKELISSMLKKYLGDGDHPQEAHDAMKSAMDHAKEMGMEGEEAEKCAGYSMKMAKHAAEKAKKEAEDMPADEDKDDKEPPMPPKKKESAEVASLRKELEAIKIERFVESEIKKLKFNDMAEKKFKESLGKPESVEDVKRHLRSFKEGMSIVSAGTVYINPEKTIQSEGAFTLADCVKGE